jgi:hypothetical protein
MDNSYLVDVIDDAMNTSVAAVAQLNGMPDDQTKVNALLQIAGSLQGDLAFVQSQLQETPKKKFYQLWK